MCDDLDIRLDWMLCYLLTDLFLFICLFNYYTNSMCHNTNSTLKRISGK